MQTQQFRDFDAFADSVRGVECKMMRHNPKARVWSIADVDLGSIKVQHGKLGSGNIVEGHAQSNAYVLYAPLSEKCVYKFNGSQVTTDQFAIVEPNSELVFSTEVEHDFCMAVVSAKLIEDSEDESSHTLQPTVRISEANRQRVRAFRELVHQILTAADACPEFESKLGAKRAAEALLGLASTSIRQRPATERRSTGRRRILRKEIIERSMALLETQKAKPVFVAELAAAASVSERTLRSAFHEYFGMGPLQYLQLRQLHLIQRALRTADPDMDSVSEIMARYGEWEFGRIASRYRRLFGEMPSETLRAT